MVESRPVSNRWRVLAPLSAAGALLMRSVPVRGQESTPVAPGVDTLASLLRAVPLAVLGDEPPQIIASWADLAAQLAATGVDRPASVELGRDALDAWHDAISPLAIPSELQFGGFTFFTRDAVGFDMTDVDQILDAGELPNKLWVLRGRFDAGRLRETWLAGGYEALDLGGVPAYSLHPDGDIDLASDIGRVANGRLNNAALLPDGTLLFARTLDLLQAAVETAQGLAPSLAERVDVQTLLAAQQDALVTGMLFFGTALAGQLIGVPSFQPDAQGTPELTIGVIDVEQPMPPIALGLVGITGGGALPLAIDGEETPDPSIPDALIVFSVLMLQPGTAELAGEIASARLATMDSVVSRIPYRELFASWETEALADGQVLRLEITTPAGAQAGIWYQFLFNRDALFLAW